MESVEVYTSNFLAMESDNTEEIEILDSTMFEARWIILFKCPNIIIARPGRGTCTSRGRVSTPPCCQSRRPRLGLGAGRRTAGPAGSVTLAATRAAAASGLTSLSSSSSSGDSQVNILTLKGP